MLPKLLLPVVVLAVLAGVRSHKMNEAHRDFFQKQIIKFREEGRVYQNLGKTRNTPKDTEWVEKLIDLFRMGDEQIDLRDNVTDILIVVGWTGVGKSTLTQVVAGNEGNPLDVVCNEFEQCWIIDLNGTISNNETIISETFLPNMVLDVDHIPHTAFYDCPGFGDTRSVEIEIANSYFMKKVADHGLRVKIMIVALHPDFDIGSYRDRLPQLLKKLVEFIKNVDVYKDGISLVVNKREGTRSDTAQINVYRNSLETLKRDLLNPDGFQQWTEEEKNSGVLIIDSLVREDADNSHLWFFPYPEPLVPGPLHSFVNLQQAKSNITELIWEKLDYGIPSPGHVDFGFALTGDAKLKLRDAVIVLNEVVADMSATISLEIVEDLVELFTELKECDTTNFPILQERVSNLTAAIFPTFSPGQELTHFMAEIVMAVEKFTTQDQYVKLSDLLRFSEYLKFMVDIDEGYLVDVKPNTWVEPFIGIAPAVFSYVSEYAEDIKEQASDALFEISVNRLNSMYLELLLIPSLQNQETQVTSFLSSTTEVEQILSNVYDTNTTLKFQSFLILYTVQYVQKLDCSESEFVTVSELVPIIEVIESLGILNWRLGKQWLKPVGDMRLELSSEENFIKFLLSLFNELSESPVQVENKGLLHDWRKLNPETNLDNLPQFFNHFSTSGIGAVTSANQESLTRHLTGNIRGLDYLNILLNYTLQRVMPSTNCPSQSAGQIIFEERYIKLSYVFGCLQGSIPSKVIITAQEKIFFDSPFPISTLTSSSISLFVITSIVQAGTSLSLQGINGRAPDPTKIPGTGSENGLKGEDGTDGSNFYSIYERISGVLSVSNCGGAGGNGQGGADGKNGERGQDGKTFTSSNDWIPESECAAWSGGDIQVRLHPNSCNSPSGGSCNAPDSGVWVTLTGSGGTSGTAGGIGGDLGRGGIGGVVFELKVDSNSTLPRVQKGSSGVNGNPGRDGTQGSDGAAGTGNRYRIDDMLYDIGQKRCKIMERGKFSKRFAQPLHSNNTDQNAIQKFNTDVKLELLNNIYECSQGNIASVPITEYKTHIDRFILTAQNTLNVFVHDRLTGYVNNLMSHDSLP